jgi:hypothetical protein
MSDERLLAWFKHEVENYLAREDATEDGLHEYLVPLVMDSPELAKLMAEGCFDHIMAAALRARPLR